MYREIFPDSVHDGNGCLSIGFISPAVYRPEDADIIRKCAERYGVEDFWLQVLRLL